MNPNQPELPDQPFTPEVAQTPQVQAPTMGRSFTPLSVPTRETMRKPVVQTPPAPIIPVDTQPQIPETTVEAPAQIDVAQGTPIAPVVAETPINLFAASEPTIAPAANATDQPMSIGSGPALDQKNEPKRLSKPALFGIIGGIVVLALVGAAAYYLLNTVSKEEYAAAASQYSKVFPEKSELPQNLLMYSVIAETNNPDLVAFTEQTEGLVEEVKVENAKLAALKAVKAGEGRKLYAAYNEKLSAYLSYASTYMVSYTKFSPSTEPCDAVGDETDASKYVALIKNCATSLKAVGDLPNADFKAYITQLAEAYGGYATAYENSSNLTDPQGTQKIQYAAAQVQLREAGEKLDTVSSTYYETMTKKINRDSIKDTGEALSSFLVSKSN